jgi:hypothetical protein
MSRFLALALDQSITGRLAGLPSHTEAGMEIPKRASVWSNASAKNLDMSLNDGGTVITATFHLVTPAAAFAATAMTVEDATGATFRDIASYTNANGSGFIAQ